MADLPNYPEDPLDEKQMSEFVLLCLEEREQNYKKYSDKIGASCAEGSKTPVKIQKQVIDRIKEVIKAKPQKHSAKQKFFALKLLNKIVMKKNMELNNYVEAKIMSRLTILAEFNNNPEEKSAQLLLSRGKNIFGPDEKDHQNSANFLIILLDCIEKWALTFQFEEGEVDDAVSSSTRSKSQTGDKFYRCYTKLLDKGVKFPSTFQGKERQVKKEKRSADQDEGPPQAQAQPRPSGASAQQVPDDAQSQSTTFGISAEKKERIGQLKKKMQKVKEMSKQAKKFLDRSGQKKGDEIVDVAEVLQQQAIFEENKKLGETAISELMSDEIQPHISNSDQLAEKLFGYQDMFDQALQTIEKQIEEQRKIEAAVMGRGPEKQEGPFPARKGSFNSDENAHVGEEMPENGNKVAVSATSMGGRLSHNMGQQPLRQSMATNLTAASEVQFEFAMPPNKNPPQDFKANDFKTNANENPYDFGDFNNKAMFSTHQQADPGFDAFNFDMPPQHSTAVKAKPNVDNRNDFGFDFGVPAAPVSKSQQFAAKAPALPEEEDAVIQPRTKKLPTKSQMPSNAEADDVEQHPIGEENYCSNDFSEQVDRQAQDDNGNEFEGRKSVSRTMKNKNNISEFKARNNQINERHSRLSISASKQNAFEQPANNEFDFNFGGGPPESAPKPAAQNQGFDFGFDQQPPPAKPQANEGFQFDEQPAPPKVEEKQGFDQFDFGTHQESAVSAPSKDDFFSYAEPGAQAPRSQQPNQGFNDFNFDNYDGNQLAQDQKQQEKGTDFNDQAPEPSQGYDNQIDSSSYPKNDYYGYGDDYYHEKPQEVSGFEQHDQQKAPESSSGSKLSPNKDLFDYAEEVAARRLTTQNQKSTTQVEMPAGGRDDTESMASLQSDDIPAKLKNEKDLEIEKEIKKLREYIKDERITRWWQGQQGQASDDLKASVQQNYGLHQKSLMTKISQQIEQADSYKTQIYSFEQENRLLNEKYQQMVNNQSEDARRVSELEFEVDSFNAQISMIRQQCEKELRNKDDEVQEMKRAVEAMKQEVEVAQKRCEHVNMLEDNHKAALLQKDQELEGLRQQLQDAQLDSQLRQQKISNFDIDKQDYEKQIRNLQEQLAEEISRSEASQANDIAVADIKETLQAQFGQKEKAMQAKIAELEAQLSMAMSAEIKSEMQKETKVVEEKPIDQFNFNMPPPQQDKPVEQQLGVKQKQDSASSGNQGLPQRPSLPQGQRGLNDSQLDFASPGIGSQSMVVQPAEANYAERSRGSVMGFQNQDQKAAAPGSKASESTQGFGASVQSATTGPGSASQTTQPNPAFSFDMFGAQPAAAAKPDQASTPRTMGAQRASPKSQMQHQNLPGQQQTAGQRPGTQVFQTNPVQPGAQAAGAFDQRRASTASSNPGMQVNTGMMKAQFQTSVPGGQTPPAGSMQGQFQQNFQQELLKQKLSSFHVNSLIQGDKCVIYEDVNVKIGLVRQYTAPQGPNGEIKCLFKVFFRNHNQQQIPMHGVHMQFQVSEHGPQQQLVRVQRSSRPLPIRVPNTPPLKHNETIELDCDMSIRPVANPNVLPQQSTSVQGVKALKFASIVLNLQYELNNGKKSGLLPIFIPINVLNFIAPCKSLNKYEYQGIWNKVVNTPQSQRPANAACLQTMFTLDKQKVANMQKLMQVMTYCFNHVPEVDPQPNQLSFAAQLKETCLPDANQDRAWVLVKMELTKDGANCKLQCITVKDNLQVALPVFESVLALVSKQA